jgi:DNA-binding NtrC family response regulator
MAVSRAAASAASHKILIALPNQITLELFLRGDGPWILGASHDCDIPIRARGVSRRHLRLSRDGQGLRFEDLNSTNGTILNGSRVAQGTLPEGVALQIGESSIMLGDSQTGKWPAPSLPAMIRPLSFATILDPSGGTGLEDADRRHFSVDDVAHLVGRFLAESRIGQEWAMICKFVGESLRCSTVRCYEWVGDQLALKGGFGDFPEERLSLETVQQIASLSTVGSLEATVGGEALIVVHIPVTFNDKKICFLGAASSGGDPVVRFQEILPVLYVLCRLILRWAEELSSREVRVAQLTERIRDIEAGLAANPDAAEPIVGQSPSLLQEIRSADKVAPADIPVLLVGPTGSGKELFARRIHRLSKRTSGPFIPINCASIPENLLESELFGVERGAYTGADRSRTGLFERASGGTLFLDEIADLPMSLQPKLLRVLEEKRVWPLGGGRPKEVDVRLLAATNQDPSNLIRQGRFREDLYYRLAGGVLRIPPLSQRGPDTLLLANYFLHVANREFGKAVRGFEDEAAAALLQYTWPGNVRQLQAVIKQVVLLEEDVLIRKEAVLHAVGRFQEGAGGSVSRWSLPWPQALEKFEEEYFRRRLAHHKGSVTALAKELGMTRANLYIKMKKLGIKPGEEPE